MLRLFKTDQLIVVVILVLYALVLRFTMFNTPVQTVVQTSALFGDVVFNWIQSRALLSGILGLVLALTQALHLNYIVKEQRMAPDSGYLVALCYMLLVSSSPHFATLSPQLMANSFVILALHQLFSAQKKRSIMGQLFNFGFWVAIASLFYFSVIVFVLLGVMGILILRNFDIREFISLLSGSFAVYFLLGVYYFWYDSLDVLLDGQIGAHFKFMVFDGQLGLADYIQFSTLAGILLWAVLNLQQIMAQKSVNAQQYLSLLYWMLLIGLLSLACQDLIQAQHLIILLPALSVLLAVNFETMSSRILAEAIHMVLFLAVIANMYQGYFFAK